MEIASAGWFETASDQADQVCRKKSITAKNTLQRGVNCFVFGKKPAFLAKKSEK